MRTLHNNREELFALVGVEGDLAVAAGLFKELEDDKHSAYLKYGARLSEAFERILSFKQHGAGGAAVGVADLERQTNQGVFRAALA